MLSRRQLILRFSVVGSHDSFTYSLRLASDVGPDQPRYIRRLVKLSGPVGRHILMNWSRTESLSVVEQLNLGIR